METGIKRHWSQSRVRVGQWRSRLGSCGVAMGRRVGKACICLVGTHRGEWCQSPEAQRRSWGEAACLQGALQFLAPGLQGTQWVCTPGFAFLELPLRPKNESHLRLEVSFICILDTCNSKMMVKITKYLSQLKSEHSYLLDILSFSDIFIPHLYPWTAQAFQHFCRVQTH